MDVAMHSGIAPRSGVPGDGAARAGSPALGISTETETRITKSNRRNRFIRRAEGQSAIKQSILDAFTSDALPEDFPTWVDAETGEIRPQLPKVCKCSWALGDSVLIRGGDGVRASWSMTQRCASIWACPVCAGVIRAERTTEIQQAVTLHQQAGGGLLFVTLTIRHRRRHELRDTLNLLREAFPNWRNDRRVKAFLKEHGCIGRIRSVEITYGDVNGWHPHVHMLLFMSSPVSEDDAHAFKCIAFDVWKRVVVSKAEKLGLTAVTPHLDRDGRGGVDVQRVDEDGRVVAAYLAKMQDDHQRTWNVGAEMTRGDVKAGNEDNLTPFQLLDRTGDKTEDAHRRALFADYYMATKGYHAIEWSNGLKVRFRIGEKSDKEIIDDTKGEPVSYEVGRHAYQRIRSIPSIHAGVLDWAEDGDWATVDSQLHGRRFTEEEGRLITDAIDAKLHADGREEGSE